MMRLTGTPSNHSNAPRAMMNLLICILSVSLQVTQQKRGQTKGSRGRTADCCVGTEERTVLREYVALSCYVSAEGKWEPHREAVLVVGESASLSVNTLQSLQV